MISDAPALQAAGKSGGGGGAAGGSQQGTGSTSAGACSPARRGAGSPAPGDEKGSLAQVSNAHEAAPVRPDCPRACMCDQGGGATGANSYHPAPTAQVLGRRT